MRVVKPLEIKEHILLKKKDIKTIRYITKKVLLNIKINEFDTYDRIL